MPAPSEPALPDPRREPCLIVGHPLVSAPFTSDPCPNGKSPKPLPNLHPTLGTRPPRLVPARRLRLHRTRIRPAHGCFLRDRGLRRRLRLRPRLLHCRAVGKQQQATEAENECKSGFHMVDSLMLLASGGGLLLLGRRWRGRIVDRCFLLDLRFLLGWRVHDRRGVLLDRNCRRHGRDASFTPGQDGRRDDKNGFGVHGIHRLL